jgi:hypothetical protein
MRAQVLMTSVGVVLVIGGVTVGLRHEQHVRAQESANRGTLTSSEYDRAVAIARSEIEKDDASVSAAVAYVVPGRVQAPNLKGECRSGHVLVVSLVGTFPHIIFGTGVAGGSEPEGPDHWVTVKADAVTGDECLTGVSIGRFKAAPGAANLVPAL